MEFNPILKFRYKCRNDSDECASKTAETIYSSATNRQGFQRMGQTQIEIYMEE